MQGRFPGGRHKNSAEVREPGWPRAKEGLVGRKWEQFHSAQEQGAVWHFSIPGQLFQGGTTRAQVPPASSGVTPSFGAQAGAALKSATENVQVEQQSITG